MRILLLIFILLAPVAWAAPQCDPNSPSITTVEGIGTIYSSADASDGRQATFIDACLEQNGWVLRAPFVLVNETATGVLVSADNAQIETEGATGTVKKLEVRGGITYLEKLNLTLLPSYQISGFSSGKYLLSAERGQLEGQKLRLSQANLQKVSDSGVVFERYSFSAAVLENQNATLSQLVFGSPNLGIQANVASSSANGVQLGQVTGLIGRNSAGSEVSFSANSALRLENGVYRLENATLNLFGIPIYLGRWDYDPRCPFEFPVVFGVGGGLTLGVENLLLSCDGKVRGTFAVYNLFGTTTTPPITSSTALALSVNVVDGTSTYFLGQAKGETFRGSVQHEPATGFTSGFSFNSGAKLESSLRGLRSLEGRVGAAYTLNLEPFSLRPKLELGTIGESTNTVTRDFHGFLRGTISANIAYTIREFTLTGSWLGRLTYYFGDVYNGFNADYVASAGVSITFPFLSFSTTFANTEQPIAPPFTSHVLSPATTLSANLRINPSFGTLPLGYSGLALEQPYVGINLIYNLRTDAFSEQSLGFGTTISLYDGSTPTDHLGNPFQTPLLSFAPRANYNFIPQTGSFGASLTYFGLSFAYTLSIDVNLPKYDFKFGFGIRLR